MAKCRHRPRTTGRNVANTRERRSAMFRPTRIDMDAREKKPAAPVQAGPTANGFAPVLAVGAVILVVVVALLLAAWRKTEGLTTQVNTLKAQQPICGSYTSELVNMQR